MPRAVGLRLALAWMDRNRSAPAGVGDGGALLEGHEDVGRARHDHLGRQLVAHHLLEAQGHVEDEVLLHEPAAADGAGIVAAVAGVDDDPARAQAELAGEAVGAGAIGLRRRRAPTRQRRWATAGARDRGGAGVVRGQGAGLARGRGRGVAWAASIPLDGRRGQGARRAAGLGAAATRLAAAGARAAAAAGVRARRVVRRAPPVGGRTGRAGRPGARGASAVGAGGGAALATCFADAGRVGRAAHVDDQPRAGPLEVEDVVAP